MFKNRLTVQIIRAFRQNLLPENYPDTIREMVAVLVWMLSTYAFYLVLKESFPRLTELFSANLVVIVSSYFIVDGLIYSLLYRNLHELSQQISSAKIDYIILLPTNFQTYTSFRRIQMSSSIQLPIALILVFFLFKPTFFESILWLGSLILGFVIAYFFWYFLSLIAFWLKVDDKVSIFFEELSLVGLFPLQPFLSLNVIWFFFPFLSLASFSAYGLIYHSLYPAILIQLALIFVLYFLCRFVESSGLRHYRS